MLEEGKVLLCRVIEHLKVELKPLVDSLEKLLAQLGEVAQRGLVPGREDQKRSNICHTIKKKLVHLPLLARLSVLGLALVVPGQFDLVPDPGGLGDEVTVLGAGLQVPWRKRQMLARDSMPTFFFWPDVVMTHQ